MLTDDFFHDRVDQMIDLHHPSVLLANRLSWPALKQHLRLLSSERIVKMKINDLFDTALVLLVGV